jgi:GntR family transcriptional regulator
LEETSSAQGSLPIYLQVTELIIRDIAAGRLIDGEKLPPERDMAADLGIAVGTLRKALAELQNRGLLERVQAPATMSALSPIRRASMPCSGWN